MDAAKLFRYLALPARGAPLLLIVTFTIMLLIAIQARIIGIPLAFITISWFFKYSFVVLDSVIDGRKEPPTLSAEMVNPVEQRPFGMLLLLIAFYFGTDWLEQFIGANGVLAVRIVGMLLVPAMVGAMSITGRFVDALNPVDVGGIVVRMPLAYVGLVGLVALLWVIPPFVLGLFDVTLPTSLVFALGMYLWLAMMSVIGGMLFEHRAELEFEPAESPERLAARKQAQLDRERDRLMDTIFAEVRGGAFATAGASVRKLIEASSTPLNEFRWLYVRAATAADQRLADYLVQYALPSLLAAHATGEALDLVRARLRSNANFRPLISAQLLRVASLARDAGDKPTARLLLVDFDRHFPNDAAAVMATRLNADLAR